jgi:hypothetical protein
MQSIHFRTIVFTLAIAGCGSAGTAVDSGLPDSGLPQCPQGAGQGQPCVATDPECAIPGGGSESSPLHCLCPCNGKCYWETDLIGAPHCDGGTDAATANDAAPVTDAAPPSPDGGFHCGTPCTAGQQYCFISNYGDGGLSPGTCIDFQQGCNTCPCLQTQHQCITTCVEQDGIIYLICPKL